MARVSEITGLLELGLFAFIAFVGLQAVGGIKGLQGIFQGITGSLSGSGSTVVTGSKPITDTVDRFEKEIDYQASQGNAPELTDKEREFLDQLRSADILTNVGGIMQGNIYGTLAEILEPFFQPETQPRNTMARPTTSKTITSPVVAGPSGADLVESKEAQIRPDKFVGQPKQVPLKYAWAQPGSPLWNEGVAKGEIRA